MPKFVLPFFFGCFYNWPTPNYYMMGTALKILAVDSQPLYAQGISNCLQNLPLVAQVDTCSTFDDTLHKIRHNEPHLVFLELNLNTNRYDGFAICREIRHRYKNVFVAVLSRYNAPQLIKEARDCGAGAYIDKNACAVTLRTFLHDFYNQKIAGYYIRVTHNGLPKNTTHFKPDYFELRYILTRRELQLMKLIVNGKGHHEIETSMRITYDTYRFHHFNLLTKLRMENDVQLTRFAIENNFADEYLYTNAS